MTYYLSYYFGDKTFKVQTLEQTSLCSYVYLPNAACYGMRDIFYIQVYIKFNIQTFEVVLFIFVCIYLSIICPYFDGHKY